MTDDETDRSPAVRPPLQRSREDQVLGGVCGGLARYLGLDAALLRVGAVVLALLSGGSATFVYLVAWALLPRAIGEQVREPRPVVGNGGARDAWTAAGGELRTLATGLRQTRPAPDVDAERQERSRAAAIDRVMTALGDRLRDPEVRDGARRAAAGLSTAVGTSVDELGRRGRRNGARADGPPASDARADRGAAAAG
jgi:phage shock protein PspC (stress-responsive transcriptional regulator)